ncbi:AbaSI family restriction endonuclease [Bifidobacterium tibiigranuli]|jgi:hypothetical protein|uniref:AbaSI family restriction endonuclease n=1 Tax=Bifidobacterium tibiigranuli TaxID=2172043 RepID=UPI0034C61936
MVDRLEYIVRTLSRTKRKDYENYVVNAIWNRLHDLSIKPVSQQLIVRSPSERYFIDLYFPQANMGVECNEIYHGSRVQHDTDRKLEIFDILHQVRPGRGYEQIDVDVYERLDDGTVRWLSLDEVDAAIDASVRRIRDRITILQDSHKFEPWGEELSPAQYFASKTVISVDDDIAFPTIPATCNVLLHSGYNEKASRRRSYFVPHALREKYGDEYYFWFPKKAVAGHAIAKGWNNVLSEDGTRLYEYNETKPELNEEGTEKQRRVTFVQTLDPVTRRREYRFAGVFHRESLKVVEGVKRRRYVLENRSFPIIK